MAEPKKIIVTGGAGFIGSNAIATFLARGVEVIAVDNLSRRGSRLNLEWLHSQGLSEFVEGDVSNPAFCRSLLKQHADACAILHLAGQVAVTTSVLDPRHDFQHNLAATFHLLEACRAFAPEIQFLFSSTNKVYGSLEEYDRHIEGDRYVLPDLARGVNEDVPLDFHSPYGCSKGAAEQYVRDYHRIYGLPTVVFRQSCIYGYRQMGVEDQGWVAWFLIAGMGGKELTIFGDGRQVRDLLFVDDLVELYWKALEKPQWSAGQIFTVGGGPNNSVSLLEFLNLVKEQLKLSIDYDFSDWRPGDQHYFVADTSKAKRLLGWEPQTSVPQGMVKLYEWIQANQDSLKKVLEGKA